MRIQLYSFEGRDFHVNIKMGSKRLADLRSEKAESLDKVSSDTGISRQSIINYEQAGKDSQARVNRVFEFAGMSIENLCVLSEHFGVSPEYLLGLAEHRTPSIKMREVCNFIGLSEEAVMHLHHYAEDPKTDNTYFDCIATLLSSPVFYESMAYLIRARNVASRVSKKKEKDSEAYSILQNFEEALFDHQNMSGKDRGVSLSDRQAVEFYLNGAVERFKKVCENILKGEEV